MTLRDRTREFLYALLRRCTGCGHGIRVMLLYHSIGSDIPFGVPEPAFEAQLAFLAARFTVVPAGALAHCGQAGGAWQGENVASVTFDDGRLDNFTRAAPLLRNLGIKATFFITTGCLGANLAASHGSVPTMSATQVRALADEGHEVGAHTMTHPDLTALTEDAALQEITGAKRRLEDLLGREVPGFAYPRGRHTRREVSLVAQAGYRYAVTAEPGLVTSRSDALRMPRVWVWPGLDPGGFAARVSPAVQCMAWLRRFRERQAHA